MRSRKIRVLHDGKEFYLLDRGRSLRDRVLTLIERCDRERANGAPIVPTDLGDCVAIASWQGGEIAVEAGREAMREPFARIVERYLEETRAGRAAQPATARRWYFLSVDRLPLYSLARAHPSGLAALVYADADAARRAAAERKGVDARPIAVEETGDLAGFLTARFAEGYAGALIDERDPVFFCTGAAGQPRFLELALDSSSGELEHFLLADGGRWQAYDGEDESIEIDVDQDDLDQQMVERLGEIPFLGFHEGMRFHRLRRTDAAGDDLVTAPCDEDDEGATVCPIFHDLELAEEFVAEHVPGKCEFVPIDDLRELVERAARSGALVRIQPGGHRARGGLLWSTDGKLVLDSFSGFWTSADGAAFARDDS